MQCGSVAFTSRTSHPQQMEADISKETKEERAKRKLDSDLDRELEGTFPASDALKVTRRKPDLPVTAEQADDDRV